MIVYIGTYTGGESRGIYVGDLDLATGQLTLTGATMRVENPSFLAVDAQRRRLYAVSEVGTFDGQSGGGVSAFVLDPETGNLTALNSSSSGGGAPCHLSIDPAGRFVLVANYGGSVALLPLLGDGSLAEASSVVPHTGSSVHPSRQNGSHAHFITMDPTGRYALAIDLGTDAIEVYKVDPAQGKLALRPHSRIAAEPEAGPRHLAFHPSRRYAYVINELNSTLTVYSYDPAQGSLSELQSVSTLPDGFRDPNFPADVHVHPSGLLIYGSNRGHDSIAIFTINPETGHVSLRDTVPAGGKNPRGFAIDPAGIYLIVAHQDSDTVVTFTIDSATGDLTPTGHSVHVPKPVCVKFLPLD